MAKKAKEAARVVAAIDKKYELMLVLQPDLLESGVEKKLKEFEKFLSENGGTVDMKDNWGKQKLAYKIGRADSGTYVVYNVTLPTTFNQELDEHLRIDKDVIRFLHVSLKDDYAYEKFEEEAPAPKEEPKKEAPVRRKTESTTHKAATKEKAPEEVKDKGKKADSSQLDDKLDKLLGGDDLNI
ncbi:MAG: 30S ribosomal protein S6 [Candidatus Peregrinibacteria bacterium]|nr:30S ribosomal protein S6 [Candidatus Peregrinibacteria bacterium]